MKWLLMVSAVCLGSLVQGQDSVKNRRPASPPAQDFYSKFSSIEDTQAAEAKPEKSTGTPANPAKSSTATNPEKMNTNKQD